MPGLLDMLTPQDILQLIELQRQLGQSPFNQMVANQGAPNYYGRPDYNWLQPSPQPQAPPPAPPGSSYLPAPSIRPDTATPLPPLPERNPRFKTIQDAINDAALDNPILEDATRQGHSPPMYSPQEFFTDKKRKSRKAV